MTCPNCERYKQSASRWRNEAYKASGHPLPWEPDELWQGLTEDEIKQIALDTPVGGTNFARAIEAKLREKNHG